MTVESKYIALAGGLDEHSPVTLPKQGRLLSAQNLELVFGSQGYNTINGYERLDGRPLASTATYTLLRVTSGLGTPIPGGTITAGAASGYVLRAALVSGSGGLGSAVYDIAVTDVAGAFIAPSAIAGSGLTSGVMASFETGDYSLADWATDIPLARTVLRNRIAQPVGEGAILGVKVFNGTVYCMRNAVGNATATLWKSSAGGWVAARTGLRPGGAMRASVENFSGSKKTRSIYGVDGKNRHWQYDGSTFTFGDAIWATDGTSATNLTPAAGAKVFTTTETVRGWVAGDSVIAYSSTDASIYMIGTVTSWVSPTLTLNITSFAGAASNSWHITETSGQGRAFDLCAHRSRLFLAYPNGQVQSSGVGAPLTLDGTSVLFAIGAEVAGMRTLRGETLLIAGDDALSLLYGTGATINDWDLKKHSASSGARRGSIQEVAGNAIYLSDPGIMTLAGTADFGDFNAAAVSRDAIDTAASIMAGYQCTSIVRSASQYRVYGADMRVLVMTATADGAMVKEGAVGFTPLTYLHQPVCADSESYGGQEIVVFGTADGWVMRERSGTSLDGAAIEWFLRTTYWHNGKAFNRKRHFKLTLDSIGADPATVFMRQDFNVGSDEYEPGSVTSGEVRPSGGRFNEDAWNTFFWSEADATQLETDIEGVGTNMSITLWGSSDAGPIQLFGLIDTFTFLGLQR
jgi:hypothetical protein